MATGIVVNTENVKELPTSWEVLTSEGSKGQNYHAKSVIFWCCRI